MDRNRLDWLTKAVASPRRTVFGLGVASVMGGLGLDDADTKKGKQGKK